jgi:hypothetical protein
VITFKIYGCAANPETKSLVRSAAAFLLKELLPRKQNITIAIKVVVGLVERESMYGECHHLTTKPSKFVVRINAGMTNYETVSTLAHEFVHIRQFDRKQLVFGLTSTTWKGTAYDNSEFSYDEMPWEIEANSLEDKLAWKFIEQNPNINIKQ